VPPRPAQSGVLAGRVTSRGTRAAKTEAAEWQQPDAAIDAIGATVEELHRRLDDATKWLHN
jgi:hypothetical protein